jgi:hypothetical protein
VKLILENIRTFSGRHTISIKPLTIVTGENSSGKTTLLGMFSALCDQTYPIQPNFNSPPYNFGNYDTIATNRRSKSREADHFSLGYIRESLDQKESQEQVQTLPVERVEARYNGRRGQIRLESFEAIGKDFEFFLVMDDQPGRKVHGKCRIRIRDRSLSVDLPEVKAPTGGQFKVGPLMQLLLGLLDQSTSSEEPKQPDTPRDSLVVMEAFNRLWSVPLASALSVAPIRTKPERTYSQITETFKPTGDHVPFLLDEVLSEESADRSKLLTALLGFGEEAHLFRKFRVKHLGKKATDPFELMVSTAGHAVNLVDVGYGISQSLPVVVQATLKDSAETLLLQQPEVHLHPRAQAALGSFFSRIASSGSGNLIVETHSDYIIDRVRQEVAARTISPDRVLIIYLHRKGEKTIPHEMRIDAAGNLLNVPSYYREFFLREGLNLLNRGKRN